MMSGGRIWRGTLSFNYSIARYVLLQNTLLLLRYTRNKAFHFWIQQFVIKTLLLLISNINNIVELDKIDTDFPP